MTQEEFSGRDITDKFPNIAKPTIISILGKAVSDGKLLKVSRGMYKKVKEV